MFIRNPLTSKMVPVTAEFMAACDAVDYAVHLKLGPSRIHEIRARMNAARLARTAKAREWQRPKTPAPTGRRQWVRGASGSGGTSPLFGAGT